MPTTRICLVVDVPADRLWAKLSEYGTWGTWLTHVAESHIETYDSIEDFDVLRVPVGAVRACGDPISPRVRERLVCHDDATRTISYEITEPPVWRFPGRRYRGTAKVIALTDLERCVIEWSGSYDCDQKDETYLQELLSGLYRSFVAGLIKAAIEERPPQSVVSSQ
jgi:hypothetical protein